MYDALGVVQARQRANLLTVHSFPRSAATVLITSPISVARQVDRHLVFVSNLPVLRISSKIYRVNKRITERIEYKLLSLTYKVLTTTQPSYLHNLITVQPPRSIRSSSLVTLARPST